MASPVVCANLVATDCVCKVEGAATGNKALLISRGMGANPLSATILVLPMRLAYGLRPARRATVPVIDEVNDEVTG